MDRTQAHEFLVFLRTDPELYAVFRKMQIDALRDSVVDPMLERATAKGKQKPVPPGMWTYEQAARMSGHDVKLIKKYVYQGCFQGGDGLVHQAEYCDYVMTRCQRVARATLQANLTRMKNGEAPCTQGELFASEVPTSPYSDTVQHPAAWEDMVAEEREFPNGQWTTQFAARMCSSTLYTVLKYVKKGLCTGDHQYLNKAEFVQAVMERAHAARRRTLHENMKQLEAARRSVATMDQPMELAIAS